MAVNGPRPLLVANFPSIVASSAGGSIVSFRNTQTTPTAGTAQPPASASDGSASAQDRLSDLANHLLRPATRQNGQTGTGQNGTQPPNARGMIAAWHKGRRGEGLYFVNANDGGADVRTLHAGLRPRAGEKWIVSQFVRSRPVL